MAISPKDQLRYDVEHLAKELALASAKAKRVGEYGLAAKLAAKAQQMFTIGFELSGTLPALEPEPELAELDAAPDEQPDLPF